MTHSVNDLFHPIIGIVFLFSLCSGGMRLHHDLDCCKDIVEFLEWKRLVHIAIIPQSIKLRRQCGDYKSLEEVDLLIGDQSKCTVGYIFRVMMTGITDFVVIETLTMRILFQGVVVLHIECNTECGIKESTHFPFSL